MFRNCGIVRSNSLGLGMRAGAILEPIVDRMSHEEYRGFDHDPEGWYPPQKFRGPHTS